MKYFLIFQLIVVCLVVKNANGGFYCKGDNFHGFLICDPSKNCCVYNGKPYCSGDPCTYVLGWALFLSLCIFIGIIVSIVICSGYCCTCCPLNKRRNRKGNVVAHHAEAVPATTVQLVPCNPQYPMQYPQQQAPVYAHPPPSYGQGCEIQNTMKTPPCAPTC